MLPRDPAKPLARNCHTAPVGGACSLAAHRTMAVQRRTGLAVDFVADTAAKTTAGYHAPIPPHGKFDSGSEGFPFDPIAHSATQTSAFETKLMHNASVMSHK